MKKSLPQYPKNLHRAFTQMKIRSHQKKSLGDSGGPRDGRIIHSRPPQLYAKMRRLLSEDTGVYVSLGNRKERLRSVGTFPSSGCECGARSLGCPSRVIPPLSPGLRQSCCLHGPSDTTHTAEGQAEQTALLRSNKYKVPNFAQRHEHSYLCGICLL